MRPTALDARGRRAVHLYRAGVLLAALIAGIAWPVPMQAGAQYANVAGYPLQVHVALTDRSGAALDYNVNAIPPLVVGQLPTAAQQAIQSIQQQSFLTQPLNQYFDQTWSGTTDATTGKTLRQTKCDAIPGIVQQNASSDSSYSPYDFECYLDTSGTLSAAVQGTSGSQQLLLRYQLLGNSLVMRLTTPFTCAKGTILCPTDPKYRLTFDAEIDLAIPISSPGCDLTPVVTMSASDGQVSGADASADILDSLKTAWNFFTLQPTNIFQQYQDLINNYQGSISVASLASGLSNVGQGCTAMAGLGFTQFDASLNQSLPAILLRFSHPYPDPPTVSQLVPDPNQQTLTHSTVSATGTEVKAGGQLGVNGTYFLDPQSSDIKIGWTDTVSQIATSEVNWGPANGRLTTATVTRHPSDSGASFDATSLTAGTGYQFRVRDCDQITCSKWSDWQTFTTSTAGTGSVQFYLDAPALTVTGSQSNTNPNAISAVTGPVSGGLGGAAIKPDGTFTGSASIPSTASAGPHPLFAVNPATGQQAQTSITVVSAGQALPSQISMIDPSTSAYLGSAQETQPFTLQLQGWGAGTITVYLDSASGTSLGTVKATGSGAFTATLTMPSGTAGSHTLVATESVNGQTLQGSAPNPITVTSLPH